MLPEALPRLLPQDFEKLTVLAVKLDGGDATQEDVLSFYTTVLQPAGMPWLLDTKYLFYNQDMLTQAGFDAGPTTWEELITQATAIKEKGIVEYPITRIID